jgi:hypothetical protein
MILKFFFEDHKDIVQFTNDSDFILKIYIIPVKPKRKYKLFVIIQPKSFILFTDMKEFDLSKLSFSYEVAKKQ